ncbi:MAG: SRPBCC family protein [Xanthobacteraceae bacterium]|nr:SRPBCC family protein [Xanthobacteraceae bacterium]
MLDKSTSATNDPRLDLVMTRFTKLPRAILWRCWTEPEHLMPWFCPLPWKTIDCEIDLKPGGIFRATMLSPEGKEFPNTGCYLEVVRHERLVWTDALLPGFRPSENPFMTAILTFEDHPDGTKYVARALHKNDADRKKHEDMGFEQGWGTVFEQLVAYAQKLK